MKSHLNESRVYLCWMCLYFLFVQTHLLWDVHCREKQTKHEELQATHISLSVCSLGGNPQPDPQLTQSHSYFFNQVSAPVPDKPNLCCRQNLLSEGQASDESRHVSFIYQFLLSITVQTLSQMFADSLFMMRQQTGRQHPNVRLWTAALEVTAEPREAGMSHCCHGERDKAEITQPRNGKCTRQTCIVLQDCWNTGGVKYNAK